MSEYFIMVSFTMATFLSLIIASPVAHDDIIPDSAESSSVFAGTNRKPVTDDQPQLSQANFGSSAGSYAVSTHGSFTMTFTRGEEELVQRTAKYHRTEPSSLLKRKPRKLISQATGLVQWGKWLKKGRHRGFGMWLRRRRRFYNHSKYCPHRVRECRRVTMGSSDVAKGDKWALLFGIKPGLMGIKARNPKAIYKRRRVILLRKKSDQKSNGEWAKTAEILDSSDSMKECAKFECDELAKITKLGTGSSSFTGSIYVSLEKILTPRRCSYKERIGGKTKYCKAYDVKKVCNAMWWEKHKHTKNAWKHGGLQIECAAL